MENGVTKDVLLLAFLLAHSVEMNYLCIAFLHDFHDLVFKQTNYI